MEIVLHTRPSGEFRRQVEQAFGADSITVIDGDDRAAFAAASKRMEVLLHVLTPVTAAMIAAAPRLKLIQKIGVGVNTIDLEAARAHRVAVCNMPGTNSQAVAEQALALMLAVLRRIPALDSLTRAGQGWHADSTLLDSTGEIGGRTVGLFGLGHSARLLARAVEALGATVLYTATRRHADQPYTYVERDELFQRSDILSLHVPLTNDTRHVVDQRALALLPKGAILINTARGELVDEAALCRALASGHLRGAGLDVFEREPAGAGNPLFSLPQVVATPHLSWLTPETLRRSMAVAAENSRRVAAGLALLHQVA